MSEIDREMQNRFSKDEILPGEQAPLPSCGKIYPPESPLHCKEFIPIKCMSAAEEDILNNKSYLKQGIALDKLLSSVILDKKIKIEDMISGDKNTILMFVRIIGYGPEYDVDNIRCDNCGKLFNTTINLNKIPIKKLDTNPIQIGINQFEFKLPKCGKNVKFHFLTTKDDAIIEKAEENKKKVRGEFPLTPITTRLYHQIDEIEGIDEKNKMKFIQEMTAYDSMQLRSHIDNITPGPTMKSEISCPHCDDIREQFVPIGVGFFWPKTLA